MLRIIKNDTVFYMASIPNGFKFIEGNKYNFITRHFGIKTLQEKCLPQSHNMFHNLLSDYARQCQTHDEVLPITVKNYYLMSMQLLDSKVWYNKRDDKLVDIKK